MRYTRPNLLLYRLAQVTSWFVAAFVFRRRILRNEIKGKQGAYVVIANHQAAYDFVNLIGLTRRPMTFVISSSFYNSLPIKGFLDRLGVIPKQQFQTSVQNMKKMKSVIAQGQPLVIYPAGLMCEDGLSTPIPAATYKFLKWLGADVYAARTSGTYFAMPKWAKGMRPGRTHMDVYKLFSAEELGTMDVAQVRKKTEEALLFDAYREQDALRIRYHNNRNLEGLEHVLYQCPHCGTEFAMEVRCGTALRCTACGYEQTADEYAMLRNTGGVGEELRYVSDWSRLIYRRLKESVERGEETGISCGTSICMVDPQSRKFCEVGKGTLTVSEDRICLEGMVNGEQKSIGVPVSAVPTLPFGPGKYLEVQHGDVIYRCVPDDGKLVMKLINLIKIFHELSCGAQAAPCG